MSETTVDILLIWYIIFAALFLTLGCIFMYDAPRAERRIGARLFLAAPIWPLALVVLLPIWLARLIAFAWREALA